MNFPIHLWTSWFVTSKLLTIAVNPQFFWGKITSISWVKITLAITKTSLSGWAVSVVGVSRIDKANILEAAHQAGGIGSFPKVWLKWRIFLTRNNWGFAVGINTWNLRVIYQEYWGFTIKHRGFTFICRDFDGTNDDSTRIKYIQLMFECENHVSMRMFTNHYIVGIFNYWDPC